MKIKNSHLSQYLDVVYLSVHGGFQTAALALLDGTGRSMALICQVLVHRRPLRWFLSTEIGIGWSGQRHWRWSWRSD